MDLGNGLSLHVYVGVLCVCVCFPILEGKFRLRHADGLFSVYYSQLHDGGECLAK